jgi:hypothetical protein
MTFVASKAKCNTCGRPLPTVRERQRLQARYRVFEGGDVPEWEQAQLTTAESECEDIIAFRTRMMDWMLRELRGLSGYVRKVRRDARKGVDGLLEQLAAQAKAKIDFETNEALADLQERMRIEQEQLEQELFDLRRKRLIPVKGHITRGERERRALSTELRQLREELKVLREQRARWSVGGMDVEPPPAGSIVPPVGGNVESALPHESGIYFVWRGDLIFYVGQSICLRGRCTASHPAIRTGDLLSFLRFPVHLLDFKEWLYIGILQPPGNSKRYRRWLTETSKQRWHKSNGVGGESQVQSDGPS